MDSEKLTDILEKFKSKIQDHNRALNNIDDNTILGDIEFLKTLNIPNDFSNKYAFYNYCFNRTNHTYSINFIDLVGKLRRFKNKEGFAIIDSKDGIWSNNKFYEKLWILDIAYQFSRLGYEIIFEPLTNGQRRADLKIKKESFELVIELSEKTNFELVNLIENFIMLNLSRYFDKFTYSGTVNLYSLKGISKEDRKSKEQEIEDKLKKALEKLISGESCFENIVDDEYNSINFCIGTHEKIENLKDRFSEPNSYKINISDDLTFIGKKLDGKIEQLDKNLPGLLIIYGIGTIGQNRDNVEKMVEDLACKYNNFVGVIFDENMLFELTKNNRLPEFAIRDLSYLSEYLYLRHIPT
jgi:hypothetical protein